MHEHGMEHMAGHHEGFSALGMLAGLTSLVMMALVVAAALWFAHRKGLLPGLDQVRSRLRGPATATPAIATGRSEAEAWLDMALAKGEIDVAAYHERRSALRSADL